MTISFLMSSSEGEEDDSCQTSPGLNLGFLDGSWESPLRGTGSPLMDGMSSSSQDATETSSSPSPLVLPQEVRELTSAPQEGSRLQATHWLVTWSRAPVEMTREEVLAHLQTIGEVKRAVIARELHLDGTPHFHAAVSFQRQVRFTMKTESDPFTLSGIRADHRVVKPTKPGQTLAGAVEATRTYCQKSDPSPLVFGAATAPTAAASKARNTAMEQSGSVEAALMTLWQEAPMLMIRQAEMVERNLKRLREMTLSQPLISRPLEAFPRKPELPDWDVLMLGGRTGLGKTELALALLPGAAFITQLDDLRTADLSRGIILDDIEVGHMPFQAIKNLTEFERPASAYCRYNNARIPARTKRIFTTNSLSVTDWICGQRDNVRMPISAEKIEAICRRVTFVWIEERLF